MLSHKKIFITLGLTASVVFAATASMQTTEPEKHEWKNLKVLPKNISEKDLDKVMGNWGRALGVRCGFCHARDAATNKNDFASDAKPEKNMAREMMRMTEKINKKYFKADKDAKDSKDMTAAITCYVCHHGSAHPESVAPPRQGGQGGFGPGGGQGPGGQGGQRPPQPQTPPAGSTTPPPPSK